MGFDVTNRKILEGYRDYFVRSIDKDDAERDPNVFESCQKDGIWYLYSSLDAFDDEMNRLAGEAEWSHARR